MLEFLKLPFLDRGLFLIFINDLPDDILSKIGTYADDTPLLYTLHEL